MFTYLGGNKACLINPDAMFTVGFGDQYDVVFLIVIMGLRGIKCLCSYK